MTLSLEKDGRAQVISGNVGGLSEGRHKPHDYFSEFAIALGSRPAMMLSIVIPTFNSAPFVRSALESAILISRTISAEILIQDDASADDTVAVVSRVAENWGSTPSLQVNEKNVGAASNRNIAVGRASGDYILMLDADNVLDHDSTVRLVAGASQMQSDAVAAAYSEIRTFRYAAGDSHSWIMTSRHVSLRDAVRDLAMPAVSSGNWIFRKSAWESVGGYPTFAKSWDTHLFALRILSLGKALVVPQTHYHHRLRAGSNYLSYSDNHRYSAFAKVLPEIRRLLDDRTCALAERVHSPNDARIFLRGLRASLPKTSRLWHSTERKTVRRLCRDELHRLHAWVKFRHWSRGIVASAAK